MALDTISEKLLVDNIFLAPRTKIFPSKQQIEVPSTGDSQYCTGFPSRACNYHICYGTLVQYNVTRRLFNYIATRTQLSFTEL